MAKGWKCPRCSTVNDDVGVTCSGCGHSRGSVVLPTQSDTTRAADPARVPDSPSFPDPPTLGDAASDTDTPPATIPGWTPPGEGDGSAADVPFWRRIPIGWIIVGVLVFGGGVVSWFFGAGRSDSGEITKSGDLTVSDLRVGDCFDLKEPDEDVIEDVTARPCTEEHEYELFYVGSMPAGDYPDEAAINGFVETNCTPAFGTYVGEDYQTSALDFSWLFPTDSGWSDGDRSVQCAVYDPEATRLTESLRGSNR